MTTPFRPVFTALRRYFAFPACVVELALLGAFISGSILILTTSGAALFLAKEGSEAMPVFYILLAAVSIPLASGVSAVLSRWLTLQVSAGLCLASALLGLALWGMAVADLPGAAYAAYIAAYSLEILYDTLFWLLASEYLTTLDMKRHAAQLAMAFGAGGVGGGLLASLLSQYIATQTLLLVSSFLFVLSFLQCLRIGRRLTRLGDGEDEEEDRRRAGSHQGAGRHHPVLSAGGGDLRRHPADVGAVLPSGLSGDDRLCRSLRGRGRTGGLPRRRLFGPAGGGADHPGAVRPHRAGARRADAAEHDLPRDHRCSACAACSASGGCRRRSSCT